MAASLSVQSEVNRAEATARHISNQSAISGGSSPPVDGEDGLAGALPPRLGVAAGREHDDGIGVRLEDLGPEQTRREVRRRPVVGEELNPVDLPTLGRFTPQRDVLGMTEDLEHVVAGLSDQLLQPGFQRDRVPVRPTPAPTTFSSMTSPACFPVYRAGPTRAEANRVRSQAPVRFTDAEVLVTSTVGEPVRQLLRRFAVQASVSSSSRSAGVAAPSSTTTQARRFPQ